MAGAGGDELSPQGLDMVEEGPGLVVAGPPRSGRSTTLVAMARSLIAQQTPVLVIAPRRSPLRSLEGTPGVLAVLGAEIDIDFLRATLNPLERYVVVVDDAEMLYNAPNAEILERIIVSGRDADHGLILAGNTRDLGSCYSGFVATARKSRCGVLVAVDTPDDGDLFGVRLPRNAGPGPLGRGCCSAPAGPSRSSSQWTADPWPGPTAWPAVSGCYGAHNCRQKLGCRPAPEVPSSRPLGAAW